MNASQINCLLGSENLLYGEGSGPVHHPPSEITMSKSLKAGLKGNSIEEKDAKEIISGVQAMYDKIPAFIRPMLPALPEILRRIPPSAGKYTLNEIIQLLDRAYETGQLKR